MHTTIKPYEGNLSNPIVNNQECVQFIDLRSTTSIRHICIRPYVFHHFGFSEKLAAAKISLEPMENNPLQVDALAKKFSTISSGQVTINSPQSLRHYRIPKDNAYTTSFISVNNSFAKQRTLDYLESPRIECSMTGNIGYIQLHVQDEYSYDIWQQSSNFTFQAELQFADVPR